MFGKDQILWDLGLNSTAIEDIVLVKKKIDQLDKQFDLVMIAEKMDHSLLLLQDLMCWPLENLTYLSQNQRKLEERNRMTPATKKILREWLWADYMLYNHFVDILNQRLEDYGDEITIQEKLLQLEDANNKMRSTCVKSHTDNQHGLKGPFKVALPSVLGYKVDLNNTGCKFYATTEPYFTAFLREKQFKADLTFS